MATQPSSRERFEAMVRERGLERLVLFSDAVFAIAMTLLVLNLRVPPRPVGLDAAHANASLAKALGHLSDAYFAYALSFLVIALYWRAHHRKFLQIALIDGWLMFWNFAFLFGVSFLPFPTSVVARWGDTSVATILYATSLAAVGLIAILISLHAERAGLYDENADLEYTRFRAVWRPAVVPAVFLLSIPIALVSPSWAERSWLLIFPILFAADRYHARFERHPNPNTPSEGAS
jgi:uncharacterized membrane protein